MLRFILKHKTRNEISGYSGEHFFTIDGDIVKLEECLKRGGSGEYGYECNELVGVEIIYEKDKETNS
jgi:hypothetical protein